MTTPEDGRPGEPAPEDFEFDPVHTFDGQTLPGKPLATWTFSPEEWPRWLEREERRLVLELAWFTSTRMRVLLSVALAGVIAAALLVPNVLFQVVAVFVCVILVIALYGTFRLDRHWKLERPPRVAIGRGWVYLNGETTIARTIDRYESIELWSANFVRDEGVIVIDGWWRRILKAGGSRSITLRLPVPYSRVAEAHELARRIIRGPGPGAVRRIRGAERRRLRSGPRKE